MRNSDNIYICEGRFVISRTDAKNRLEIIFSPSMWETTVFKILSFEFEPYTAKSIFSLEKDKTYLIKLATLR